MIGFLSGIIHHKTDDIVVVDVSGVGYEVHVSRNSAFLIGEIGAPVRLEVHTHYNEAAFQLYGFPTRREKDLFRKLISVSGVGPKLGLALLSGLDAPALILALASGDLVSLTKISGVGKKTAERLVIELKDKFKEEAIALRDVSLARAENGDVRLQDALSALISLGYPEGSARKVLQGLTLAPDDSLQTLIKRALGAMTH
jgi:Holliday junction DNA helicase RuvA